MKQVILTIIITALLIASQPASGNLLTNGGFESGRWQSLGIAPAIDLSHTSYEGEWAAHVQQQHTTIDPGIAHDVGAGISNRFDVAGGQPLVCSWAISYTLTAATASLNVNTYGAGGFTGDYPLLVVYDRSNGGYTMMTATTTMPAEATSAEVQFEVGTDDESGPYYDVYLDAVSCQQPSNTPTNTPLPAGN